ncbi:MAG: VWA domain-containing protein [Deltaproteobacteria bacterium]|nr:VWA domain-containing protein [Deltaproteobacteria bacterium]
MTAHDPTRAPSRLGRRPLRLACLLLALTAAAGAAARLVERPAPAPAPIDLPRSFRAPGGGALHFSGALEGTAVLPGQDGLVRMELVLGAAAREASTPPVRVPTDLVVVLDRSGSMMGEKIVHARAAVRGLVEALGPADRFALVAYADTAVPVLPLGSPGASWRAAVESIAAEGGTHLSSGLDLGLAIVDGARVEGRSPRVVLISDGLANQGDTSREGLLARARRAAHGEYALSTVGVGADFDEGLMAALADAGTGNFHFLASAGGLGSILEAELATARETVATGLQVTIEPGPGVSVVDASGYPLTRAEGRTSFTPGGLFAGQERRIWVTLRVAPGARGVVPLGAFSLDYRMAGEPHRLAFSETPRVAAVADEARYVASLDRASWERSVIVHQYNALRRSVAEAVQAGREQEAVAEIQRYRTQVEQRNRELASPAVAAQLDEAAKLETRLRDAASGAAPMAPLETKELRARSENEGRPGSRK